MFLVWITVGSVVAVLALATVPVSVAFYAEHHHGNGKARGTLYWLFGLVRIPLGSTTRKARVTTARPTARRHGGKRHGGRRLIAALHAEGFAWRVLTLIQDLLLRIRVRELSVEGYLGLDDPADTGRLWAIVGPLAALLSVLPATHIAIEPRFTAEGLDVRARSRVCVIPIILLFVMVRFLLSPGTVRALRVMRAAPG